jgi:hypothetical protein
MRLHIRLPTFTYKTTIGLITSDSSLRIHPWQKRFPDGGVTSSTFALSATTQRSRVFAFNFLYSTDSNQERQITFTNITTSPSSLSHYRQSKWVIFVRIPFQTNPPCAAFFQVSHVFFCPSCSLLCKLECSTRIDRPDHRLFA